MTLLNGSNSSFPRALTTDSLEVAVVGAGVLGAVVALALAARGRDVLLVDRDAAARDRARAATRAGARLARLQRERAADLLARVTLTTKKAGLAAATRRPERLVGARFMNPGRVL